MPPQTTVCGDDVMASLERERQIIFTANISGVEQRRQWSQRKAEIEAYLAADNTAQSAHDLAHQNTPLARTTSHASSTGRQNSSYNISLPTSVLTHPQHTAKPTQHPHEDVVLDPSEYIAYIQSTDRSTSAAKRQRLDDLPTAAQPSMSTSLMTDQLGSSYSSTMLTPCSSVSQVYNASSYHLSPCSSYDSSFYGGEDMSRQGSSVSSTSMTEGFGMLRVESSGPSSFNAPFPISLDEQQDRVLFLSDSILSSVTEKPGSSPFMHATPGVDGLTLQQNDLFRDMGSGFGHGNIPLASTDVDEKNELTGTGMPWQMFAARGIDSSTTDMQRTDSQISASTDSSTSSTTSRQKAAARRQKQIANASQPLLPKAALTSNAKPAPRPIAAQKQLIPRLPSHPKTKTPLSCPDCSMTLRGPHERQRHWDNVHAPVKRVWICVQPEQSPFKPKKALDICKQCKQGKQYNVYYNAAAHLRRGHFCPSKRGRRPRGEVGTSAVVLSMERSRGPSIEEMKAHGWLKEITVPNRGSRTAVDNEEDLSDAADFDDEPSGDLDSQVVTMRLNSNTHQTAGAPFTDQYAMSYNAPPTSSPNSFAHQDHRLLDPQQEAICLQALGLQPIGFLTPEDAYGPSDMATQIGYPNSNWHPKANGAAPMMEHSFSAPGRMAVRW